MGFSILIGADLFPTPSNEHMFIDGDIQGLFGDGLLNLLKSCDYRIFNLEGALTDNSTPIIKSGPIVSERVKCINGISAIKPDLILLANNHVMDEGEEGAAETISVLKEHSIEYIGIGRTLDERRRCYRFSDGEVSVSIYNCCEHEFSIFSEGRLGCNPYDPLISFDDVDRLKQISDFVVVLYHGGREHYPYPTPNLQKVFRKFTDKGADIVIAQHTHCIGAYEDYKGSLLLYGQGNFLFDIGELHSLQNSILLKAKFERGGMKYEFIPIKKQKNKVRLDDSIENEALLSFYKRSEEIKNEGVVEELFCNWAKNKIGEFLYALDGKTLPHRTMHRLFGDKYYDYLISKYKSMNAWSVDVMNMFQCEAHNEAIIKALSTMIGRKV